MITKTIMTLGIMASFVIGLSFSSVYAGIPWDTADIADDAITTDKIKDKTVKNADIRNNQIKTGKIRDGTITSADIATNAVGFSDINQGTLFFGHYRDDAFGNANGWNPDSSVKAFVIDDSRVTDDDFVGVTLDNATPTTCFVHNTAIGMFVILCTIAPSNNAMLSYIVSGGL